MSIFVRLAEPADIPAMAAIRAAVWETDEYWRRRIGGYLAGEINPQYALPLRVVFVAVEHGKIVGFIAGHRTQRHGCQGELEWMDVAATHRRQGIAGQLIVRLAEWFVEQQAYRVCIDVQPQNTGARALYAKFGAVPLNPHWMHWPDIRVVTQRGDARDPGEREP
jgi:GNAT superfamily N-acetyltransferase